MPSQSSLQPCLSVNNIKQNQYANLPKHWVTQWLLYVLQKPASFLITDSNYVLNFEEQSQFDAGIQKMQIGTPLAYLTGKQAFWSLDFEVNEHTLIPRPDTEVLVEQVLGWIDSHVDVKGEYTKQLLDLGTGSGCIAISLAYELTHQYPSRWQVTAIDFSEEALTVAKRNAQLNKIKNIDFIKSDWFKALDDSRETQRFDVIVSNPPYIEASDSHLSELQAEPITALVADDQGLADIKQICFQAQPYLINGGLLAIEHGYDQGSAVRDIFLNSSFGQVKTVQDYGGNDRVTMGIYSE